MDFRHCLLMIGITVGCGCHLYQTATYNLINEIRIKNDKDLHQERLAERAEQVWLWTVVAGCSDLAVNEDYHTGFIDGFVDYSLDGGLGVPPPVPMPGYRRYSELSPAGISAIDSWNAGFAAGSAAAYNDTQGRRWLTVPVVGYDPNSRIQTSMEFGTADVAPGVPSSSTLNPPTPALPPVVQPENVPLIVPPELENAPPIVPPLTSDSLPPKPSELLPKPVPDNSEALPLPSLPELPK